MVWFGARIESLAYLLTSGYAVCYAVGVDQIRYVEWLQLLNKLHFFSEKFNILMQIVCLQSFSFVQVEKLIQFNHIMYLIN